jgi:hypothetical protein
MAEASITLTIRCPHDNTVKGKRAAAQAVFKASLGCAAIKDCPYTRITDSEIIAEIPLQPEDVGKLIKLQPV